MISDGLVLISKAVRDKNSGAHILWVSRLTVKEKQHWILSSVVESGIFSVQLVSMAFCELSKAIAPNFSQ
jgi:hypothetical protein